ncbi:MAG TPA: MXAN_5187 C-terminal domain-containing protein [Polyangiaceae bacterium]|nr:MAG: hypothetical protein DIU78_18485 [Pseudomonadota bacterium]HLV21015.1 MXAN_5187 C-terminal domain-containing protein [Polyangiaceae bacterium]
MEPQELDQAIEELEIRLERLRALYEQYFLGIEKIEPTVARKDVDRRLYLLRREKIRNTARRFKLQTIIQRYNTFQQYWQRICREIENGTYKRHRLRAERVQGPSDLLTIATRRRFGREREQSSAPPPPEPAATPVSGEAARPHTVPSPAPAAAIPSNGRRGAQPPPPPKRRPAGNPPPAAVPPKTGAGPVGAHALRELHARLVAASRAANRPAVSFETVEKTVKATEAALRAKHANRRILFDVVLKDGKPALKPIVR